MNRRRRYRVRVCAATLFLTMILAATMPFCWALWGFGQDEQLTTDPAEDTMPSITQMRDGTIWIIWKSDRIQTARYDLWYKTSSTGGASWSSPTRITWHPSNDEAPAITQAQDKNVLLVWTTERTGNKEILYKRYFYDEQYWSTVAQLTNNASEDTSPSITQNIDGTICVVWQRNVTKNNGSNYDIFCKTSSDQGLTWSNETRVTTDSGWDMGPSITHLENGTLLVAFASFRADGNFEIFCKTSHDNGASWSEEATRLTDGTADDINPSVVQDVNGTVWLIWTKDQDVYYMTSPFPSSEELLLSKGDNANPSAICSKERRMWVVLDSIRSGSPPDIFYMTSDEIPYVHDIAVIDIMAWGDQGVPITFVPRSIPVYINVTVENQGHFTETFNVTAYAERNARDVFISIDAQHNVSLAAGANTTLTLTWNTIDTPYGTYYISANVTFVPGEHDKYDNALIDGAKIGGICVLLQPQTSTISLLSSIALVILIIIVLGAIGVSFFKALMSVHLPRPWRLLVDGRMIDSWHR